jgi:hypothetical protein
MSRAYIRLDPGFDEHKYDYPDGAYAAYIAVLCLAEKQSQRGRFRSADYLRRMLGKRGRWVSYLIDHGDLIESKGQLYLDGWDEWQEGNWKVAERVARLRSRPRRSNGAVTPDVTVDVTVPVTPDVTPDRLSGGGGYSGAVQSGEQGGDGAEGTKRKHGPFQPIGTQAAKAS